jgi:hypothetical protein
MIVATEIQPGVVRVVIRVSDYGQAGIHWRDVLRGFMHNGYGKIYIQRVGANRRRYESCYDLAGYYRGCKGANIDECPGAMFIWTTAKEVDVDAIDAIDNQTLGRDLGNVLRRFPQATEQDLWEVQFQFI